MIPFTLLLAFFCEYLRPPRQSAWVQVWHKKLLDWALVTFDADQAIHGWAVWVIAVGAPAIASAIVYWIFAAIAAPLAWLFSVLVLYSILAFQPFVAYIHAWHKASQHDDMYTPPPSPSLSQDVLLTPSHNALDAAVQYAHQHILGLSLAYILLAICGFGPAGAVLYYGAALAVRHLRLKLNLAQSAHAVLSAWQFINWLPARAVALSFAAVGNFEQALHNWREQHASDNHRLHYCTHLLQAVAQGAINTATGTAASAQPSPKTEPAQAHHTYDPTWFEDAAPPALPQFNPLQPLQITDDDIHAQAKQLNLFAKLVWRTMFLWAVIISFISITHWIS